MSDQLKKHGMRIGIFGGSFDPPHNGHLAIAAHAAGRLGLDRTILVPSAAPPHKPDRDLTSPEDRLAMCELAVAGVAGLTVSDIELRREGVSYTVDTLLELNRNSPRGDLYLLIGMDNYLEFHLWKDPDRILEVATVVVMDRPGYQKREVDPRARGRIVRVEVPQVDVSSTQIRRLVRLGEPISNLVPKAVEEYIIVHGLYR